MVRIHDIKFENDKAEIQPNASTVLDQTAAALEKCPDVKVRLSAHTDSNGSDAYNQRLSDRRATAVASISRRTAWPRDGSSRVAR
jgi:OOP family OmpA-OmpF porin